MNLTSNEIITILLFLLPGFVTAAIFFSYTSHLKPSPFERVIQALVFSIINHAAVEVIRLCGRTLHWLSAKLDVVWIHVTVTQVVSIFDLIPNVLLYVVIAVLLGFLLCILQTMTCSTEYSVNTNLRWRIPTHQNGIRLLLKVGLT